MKEKQERNRHSTKERGQRLTQRLREKLTWRNALLLYFLLPALAAAAILLQFLFTPPGLDFRLAQNTFLVSPTRALFSALTIPGLLIVNGALAAVALFFLRALLDYFLAFFRKEVQIAGLAGMSLIFSLSLLFAYFGIHSMPGLMGKIANLEGDFQRIRIVQPNNLILLNDALGVAATLSPGELVKISGSCGRRDMAAREGYLTHYRFVVEFHTKNAAAPLSAIDWEQIPAREPSYLAYHSLISAGSQMEAPPPILLYDCPSLKTHPPGVSSGKFLKSDKIYYKSGDQDQGSGNRYDKDHK